MRRFCPYPLTSVLIFILWLALAGTYSAGSFILAALLAFVLPMTLLVLGPRPARVKNPWAALKLAGIVLADILRSNMAVMAIIFGKKRRERVSGFVRVPLTMKNRHGLAVLSLIITSTPGTLWVQYTLRDQVLLLHVLDLVDKEEWVKLIQNRYERLLMEVFE